MKPYMDDLICFNLIYDRGSKHQSPSNTPAMCTNLFKCLWELLLKLKITIHKKINNIKADTRFQLYTFLYF